MGFDISCGVRLLRSDIGRTELEPVRGRVMDELARLIPKEKKAGLARHVARLVPVGVVKG